MHLEYQEILHNHPELEQKLMNFPTKVFTGKKKDDIKSNMLFFCYAIPGKDQSDVLVNPDKNDASIKENFFLGVTMLEH